MSDQQQGTAPAVTRLAEVGTHLEVALRALGQPNAVVHGFDFCNDSYEWRRLFGELFGTFLLIMAAVGAPMVNARFGGHVVPLGVQVVALR